MKPVVDRLKQQYAGKVDIKTMPTDGGDEQIATLADRFQVQYVPTFVFANADGTTTTSIVGEVPQSTLEAEIAKLR